MKIYSFKDIETGYDVLVTSQKEKIEEFFNLTIQEINQQLEDTDLINNKFKMTIIFVD